MDYFQEYRGFSPVASSEDSGNVSPLLRTTQQNGTAPFSPSPEPRRVNDDRANTTINQYSKAHAGHRIPELKARMISENF